MLCTLLRAAKTPPVVRAVGRLHLSSSSFSSSSAPPAASAAALLGDLHVSSVPSSTDQADVYEGESKDLGWGRVFGGQIISQALLAAYETVPEGRHVHSLHSYFTLPGSVDFPITYTVDRTMDGNSYSTRSVVASQTQPPPRPRPTLPTTPSSSDAASSAAPSTASSAASSAASSSSDAHRDIWHRRDVHVEPQRREGEGAEGDTEGEDTTDAVIFSMTASFQDNEESAMEHTDTPLCAENGEGLSGVPPPEECTPREEWYLEHREHIAHFPLAMQELLLNAEKPILIRPVKPCV